MVRGGWGSGPSRSLVLHNTSTALRYVVIDAAHQRLANLPQAHDENETITMVVRIMGFVIIWAGFVCFFMPLATFSALFFTCFGDIGEKLICCITCPVATCLGCTMIAIGWIAYRPMIAIPFLIVAVLCCGGFGVVMYRMKFMDEEKKAPKHGKRSVAAKRVILARGESSAPYPTAEVSKVNPAADPEAGYKETGMSSFGM